MRLTYTKAAFATAWLLLILAVAGHVTSGLGWMAVAGLAVLPPLVVLRMWNDEPTMSESIRSILR
jgi:hypothetical protein